MKSVLIILLTVYSASVALAQIDLQYYNYPKSFSSQLPARLTYDLDHAILTYPDKRVVSIGSGEENSNSGVSIKSPDGQAVSYMSSFAKRTSASGQVRFHDMTDWDEDIYRIINTMKYKVNKESPKVYSAFSADAQHFVLMSQIKDKYYLYCFDYQQGNMLVKGKEWIPSEPYNEIKGLSTIDDGQTVFASVKTQKNEYGIAKIDVDKMQDEFISFPSTAFDQNVVTSYYFKESNELYCQGAGKIDYFIHYDESSVEVIHKNAVIGSKMFYIDETGNIEQSLLSFRNKSFKPEKPGVGGIITDNSFVVFDYYGNYFTYHEGDDLPIPEYLSLDGKVSVLEPQPDAYPLISDILSSASIQTLFDDLCRNQEIPYSLLGVLFESGEPYSEEIILQMIQSNQPFVQAYFGSRIVSYINQASFIELEAIDSTSMAHLPKFLNSYEALSSNTIANEFGLELASVASIQSAMAVKKNLSEGYHHLSAEELSELGYQTFQKDQKNGKANEMNSLKFFELAYEKEPSNAERPLNIGNVYLHAGQFENAMQFYNKSLALSPDYSLAHFSIVKAAWEPIRIKMKKLDLQTANSMILTSEEALEHMADTAYFENLYVRRAKATATLYVKNQALYEEYLSLDQYKISGQEYAQMTQNIMPRIVNAGVPELAGFIARDNAAFYVQVAQKNNHDVQSYLFADVMFDKAVKANIKDPGIYYDWARINIDYLKKKKEGLRIIHEAQSIFSNPENFDPLIADYFFEEGKKKYDLANYNESSALFTRYVNAAKSPVVNGFKYQAISLYRIKKYEQALVPFLKVKTDEKDQNRLYVFYPNWDDAVAFCQDPVGLAPEWVDRTAEIDAMQKKFEEALDVSGTNHTKAVEMMEPVAKYYDQIDYNYGQAITHNGIGTEYHHLKQYEQAKKHYRMSIDNKAISSSSYLNLSKILRSEGEIDEATGLLERAEREYNGDKNVRKLLADCYLTQAFDAFNDKSLSRAQLKAEACLKLDSNVAEAYMIKGLVMYYHGVGSLDKELEGKRIITIGLKMKPSLWQDYGSILDHVMF
ncbi:MAG: hypothetical protein JXR07_15835 [Reichenbachiella sp.]